LGVKNFDFFAKNHEKSVYFLHKTIKLTFLTFETISKRHFLPKNCIKKIEKSSVNES